MKVGDTVPVTIAGQVVTQAKVREMDKETATLVVPATLVVMAVRTELAEAPQTEPEVSTVITGVDRNTSEESTVVNEPVQEPTSNVQAEQTAPATTENVPAQEVRVESTESPSESTPVSE